MFKSNASSGFFFNSCFCKCFPIPWVQVEVFSGIAGLYFCGIRIGLQRLKHVFEVLLFYSPCSISENIAYIPVSLYLSHIPIAPTLSQFALCFTSYFLQVLISRCPVEFVFLMLSIPCAHIKCNIFEV